MIADNLFGKVLIDPADRADRLHVASGYATPGFAKHHLTESRRDGRVPFSLELVIGMAVSEGIKESDHTGFRQLSEGLGDGFRCSYLVGLPPMHSKLYVWTKGDDPVAAWVGSANYTHPGFVGTMQRNVLEQAPPSEAMGYFRSVREQSLDCRDERIGRLVRIRPDTPEDASGLEGVELPLTDRHGNVPARSGLNWGQRPGRDPDQAYLPVPGKVAQSGFFPPRRKNFTVRTDDFQSIVCAIAQDKDKAIHSTFDNAELGRYFRKRLSVPFGEPVTRRHLDGYGRDSVTIRKVDESLYLLDFSVPSLLPSRDRG